MSSKAGQVKNFTEVGFAPDSGRAAHVETGPESVIFVRRPPSARGNLRAQPTSENLPKRRQSAVQFLMFMAMKKGGAALRTERNRAITPSRLMAGVVAPKDNIAA